VIAPEFFYLIKATQKLIRGEKTVSRLYLIPAAVRKYTLAAAKSAGD
jgi:hypothetical protein